MSAYIRNRYIITLWINFFLGPFARHSAASFGSLPSSLFRVDAQLLAGVVIFLDACDLYVARHDLYCAQRQKLLESRLNMGPKAEKTMIQKIITAIGAPVFIGAIVLMVFDHRFEWSPAVPAYISILGDILAALGILMYFFVVKENRYAAAAVEV